LIILYFCTPTILAHLHLSCPHFYHNLQYWREL
jgi:hypothetical protein